MFGGDENKPVKFLKEKPLTKIEPPKCNGYTLGTFISNMENNRTKYLLIEFTNTIYAFHL